MTSEKPALHCMQLSFIARFVMAYKYVLCSCPFLDLKEAFVYTRKPNPQTTRIYAKCVKVYNQKMKFTIISFTPVQNNF